METDHTDIMPITRNEFASIPNCHSSSYRPVLCINDTIRNVNGCVVGLFIHSKIQRTFGPGRGGRLRVVRKACHPSEVVVFGETTTPSASDPSSGFPWYNRRSSQSPVGLSSFPKNPPTPIINCLLRGPRRVIAFPRCDGHEIYHKQEIPRNKQHCPEGLD